MCLLFVCTFLCCFFFRFSFSLYTTLCSYEYLLLLSFFFILTQFTVLFAVVGDGVLFCFSLENRLVHHTIDFYSVVLPPLLPLFYLREWVSACLCMHFAIEVTLHFFIEQTTISNWMKLDFYTNRKWDRAFSLCVYFSTLFRIESENGNKNVRKNTFGRFTNTKGIIDTQTIRKSMNENRMFHEFFTNYQILIFDPSVIRACG